MRPDIVLDFELPPKPALVVSFHCSSFGLEVPLGNENDTIAAVLLTRVKAASSAALPAVPESSSVKASLPTVSTHTGGTPPRASGTLEIKAVLPTDSLLVESEAKGVMMLTRAQ